MEIRHLNENDTHDYFKIRLEALKDTPEAFSSSYEETLNETAEKYNTRLQPSSQSITYGSFKDSQLIGVITLVKQSKLKLTHRADIVATYVKPDYRDQGVGKALLDTAITEAEKMNGIEQLYLTCATNNKPAKALYNSSGFKTFGTERRALKIEGQYFDIDHMALYF